MKLFKQTKIPKIDVENKRLIERGNPLATIIACFLDLKSPDDAIQIQNHYDSGEAVWVILLSKWLEERGWDWGSLEDHLYDGSHYLVYGVSPRGTSHVCIYKDGDLFHDPYPVKKGQRGGLVSETHYEFLERIHPGHRVN